MKATGVQSPYTADPQVKCAKCGEPAARHKQLVRVDRGYVCAQGACPKRGKNTTRGSES